MYWEKVQETQEKGGTLNGLLDEVAEGGVSVHGGELLAGVELCARVPAALVVRHSEQMRVLPGAFVRIQGVSRGQIQSMRFPCSVRPQRLQDLDSPLRTPPAGMSVGPRVFGRWILGAEVARAERAVLVCPGSLAGSCRLKLSGGALRGAAGPLRR